MKPVDLTTKHKNPFSVPENYFENFPVQMMDMLPEKQATQISTSTNVQISGTPLKRRKPWIYAISHISIAATICGIICGTYYLQNKRTNSEGTALATNASSVITNTAPSDEYLNEICDYAMISSNDIYAYATENE